MNDRFICKIADTEEELHKCYSMRYKEMLTEYDENVYRADGEDYTPYDDIAKQVIVYDREADKIVGSYRLVLSSDLKEGQRFMCETEYHMEKIKNSGELILELSRAVIAKEYRNSRILVYLWAFIYQFITENKVRYIIGDVSFFGVEPEKYIKEMAYIAQTYGIDDEYGITPLGNQKALDYTGVTYNEREVLRSLPPLVRAYINFGAKFSKQPFVDYDFRSVDLFVLVDYEMANKKFIERMIRL